MTLARPGWEVVRNGFSGAEFDLPAAPGFLRPLAIRSWISSAAAVHIFSKLGHDFPALRKAANQPGFKPVALDAKGQHGRYRPRAPCQSDNVVAVIPGNERPEEYIIFTALGSPGTQPLNNPGGIFNGAIRQCRRRCHLLELAEGF